MYLKSNRARPIHSATGTKIGNFSIPRNWQQRAVITVLLHCNAATNEFWHIIRKYGIRIVPHVTYERGADGTRVIVESNPYCDCKGDMYSFDIVCPAVQSTIDALQNMRCCKSFHAVMSITPPRLAQPGQYRKLSDGSYIALFHGKPAQRKADKFINFLRRQQDKLDAQLIAYEREYGPLPTEQRLQVMGIG